jgi:hypothetical protein
MSRETAPRQQRPDGFIRRQSQPADRAAATIRSITVERPVRAISARTSSRSMPRQ